MKQDATLFKVFINSKLYFTEIRNNADYLLVEHIGPYADNVCYIINKASKDIYSSIEKLVSQRYMDAESYSFTYDKKEHMNHLYSYLKDFRPWLSKPQAIRSTLDDLDLLFLYSKPIDMLYSPVTTQSYAKEAIVNISTLYHYEIPVYKKSRASIKLDRTWYVLLGDYFKFTSDNNVYVKMRAILVHSDKGDFKLLLYKIP